MLCYYFKGPYNWFYPRLSHLVRPAYLIWDRHLSSIYHTAKAFHCTIHIHTSDEGLGSLLVSRVLLLMLGMWLFNHSFLYVSALILRAQRSLCQCWTSFGPGWTGFCVDGCCCWRHWQVFSHGYTLYQCHQQLSRTTQMRCMLLLGQLIYFPPVLVICPNS